MARRRYRVCEFGHAVYDDSAVYCPKCGTRLSEPLEGYESRKVPGNRRRLSPAVSILILLIVTFGIGYAASPGLRAEIDTLLAQCKAQSTPSPTVKATPIPTLARTVTMVQAAPPTSTPTRIKPTSTPTPSCPPQFVYLADVTIPDGTHVTAGDSITKVWRVRSTSSCTWSSTISLQATGDLQATEEGGSMPLLGPGEEGEITVQLVFPQAVGSSQSSWVICDGDQCSESILTLVVVVD